jgi:hypothetical protein
MNGRPTAAGRPPPFFDALVIFDAGGEIHLGFFEEPRQSWQTRQSMQ